MSPSMFIVALIVIQLVLLVIAPAACVNALASHRPCCTPPT